MIISKKKNKIVNCIFFPTIYLEQTLLLGRLLLVWHAPDDVRIAWRQRRKGQTFSDTFSRNIPSRYNRSIQNLSPANTSLQGCLESLAKTQFPVRHTGWDSPWLLSSCHLNGFRHRVETNAKNNAGTPPSQSEKLLCLFCMAFRVKKLTCMKTT